MAKSMKPMPRGVPKTKTSNIFIADIIEEFNVYLKSIKSSGTYSLIHKYIELFGKSLGKYELTTKKAEDFSAFTFFAQIEYYNKHMYVSEDLRKHVFRYIIRFYQWLIETHPDYDFFADNPDMTRSLMMSNSILGLITKGYFFSPLDSKNIPHGHAKVCLIIKNMDALSTTYTKETYITIDMSALQSNFYRKLILEYIVEYGTTHAVAPTHPLTIIQVMQKVYELKLVPHYTNRSLDVIDSGDGLFIRRLIFDDEGYTPAHKSGIAFAIKGFFTYCSKENLLEIDNTVFDFLSTYGTYTVNPNAKKSIPNEHLVLLDSWMAERSNNIKYREMRIIFHLLLQTEFRISQICHLTVDCIHPSLTPNQHELWAYSKTSYGEKDRSVITSLTYEMLMEIINATNSIRNECTIEPMRQYIFLIPKKYSRTVIFSDCIFDSSLSKACKDLGIPHYSASNLRNTHMTLAHESILRNGKSDAEMAMLSHHKNFRTTSSHYIDEKLEEMLEATYGIIIGDIYTNTDGKVLDKIPPEYQGKEYEVEKECGVCISDVCTMQGMLPCLVCKHFFTTPEHELYFKQAIEDIDKLIAKSNNPHEREDLTVAKTLYVLYLGAIIQFKEDHNYAENDSDK